MDGRKAVLFKEPDLTSASLVLLASNYWLLHNCFMASSKDVQQKIDGLREKIRYFCRFAFMPTERPMAAVVTPDRAELLVPRLELEHADSMVQDGT